MKKLERISRPLSLKEIKTLKKVRNSRESELERGYKTRAIITAVIIGIASLYLATWTRYDLFTFILATLAVFSFAYLIIQPFETFKDRKRARSIINRVNAFLEPGNIEVMPVSATRVALAREFKDEGDLYIVDTSGSTILYMWDSMGNLKKNFPCLQFEIYDRDFAELIGRQINPLTEKIKPIEIPAKAKWNYLQKTKPEHLAIEKKNFDKLVEKILSVG